MTNDDFEAWQENPVTQYVMQALTNRADQIKAAWGEAAWSGSIDPVKHAASVAMYEAYRTLAEISFDDVQFVNGDSTEDADETE